MNGNTQNTIILQAMSLLANSGSAGIHMRLIARESGISQSVLYHYFDNKESLLKAIFDYASQDLGQKRKLLPQTNNAKDMLRQRIEFQLDQAVEVVAILKYYLYFRITFPHLASGYLPEKGYRHIEEVLERGMETQEFRNLDIAKEAKVIAHAINGFVLEYFPLIPQGQEKTELINSIHDFIYCSIKKGGE